jgi:hypothetical protein
MQIGFLGILAIVFIILKLTHVIAWSWLWVLSPLWIGFVLWLLLLGVLFGLTLLSTAQAKAAIRSRW